MMNIEGQTYPFITKYKPLAFFLIFSILLHALFLYHITTLSFSFPHLVKTKKPLQPFKECLALDAQKQISLNKTFSRFYPFLSAKGYKGKKNPSFEKGGQIGKDISSLDLQFSQGLDAYTLINTQKNALDLLALSSSETKSNAIWQHIPVNLLVKTPLILDEALFTKDLIYKEKGLNIEPQIVNEHTNILSSHLKVASKNIDRNAFEMELNPMGPASIDVIDMNKLQSDQLFAFTLDDKGFFSEKPMLQHELEDSALFDHEIQTEHEINTHLEEGKLLLKSQHFSHTTKCCKIPNSPFYVFEITLHPLPHFAFDILDQHFLFLLDRSSSIDKEVFDSFKRAISSALNLLPKEATFNLEVFDSNSQKLSTLPLKAQRKNLFKAKTYLETHDAGGLFASTDLFKALSNAFQEKTPAISNVILLSDGDTFITQSNQMKKLREFIRSISKKHLLHTVATGSKNNLPLLHLLAKLNGGELLYKDHSTHLEKTFSPFIQSLLAPIATNVLITIAKEHKQQNISLLIPKHRTPILYASKPYRIYGIVDSLDSFTLFLQGSAKDGVMTLKKHIELTATKEEPYLLQEAEIQNSLDALEKYIKDGNNKHLKHLKVYIPTLKDG
jgi:hypothetical protein